MKRKPITLIQIIIIVILIVIIVFAIKSLQKEDEAYQNIDSNGLTIETDNETVDKHDPGINLHDYEKDSNSSESDIWYKNLFKNRK